MSMSLSHGLEYDYDDDALNIVYVAWKMAVGIVSDSETRSSIGHAIAVYSRGVGGVHRA